MNRNLIAWRALCYGMLLLLLVALSGCTVLVPDIGEPPATWQPLPTLAPYHTNTPEPTPTASPVTPTVTPTQVTPTSTPLSEVLTATAAPIQPDATITPETVAGLLGIVRSLPNTARFDDYFSELRQNVQWGIAPANEAAESALAQARDSGRAVRVWGWIEYGVDDYGGARIVVERIEFASPPPRPPPGETATATSTPEEAPSSTDTPEALPSVTATPEAPASPTATSEALPSPTATLETQPSPTLETRPKITPTPHLQPVVVEGWLGIIRPLPSSSAYKHYFAARDREGQYGITSTLPPVEEQLRLYRDSGAIVRIWGILEYGVDDYGGARIYVTRIEAVD